MSQSTETARGTRARAATRTGSGTGPKTKRNNSRHNTTNSPALPDPKIEESKDMIYYAYIANKKEE